MAICGWEFPDGICCGQRYDHDGDHVRWGEGRRPDGPDPRCNCNTAPVGVGCSVHPEESPGDYRVADSTWSKRRPAIETLADALAPHMDAEEALAVAEWIVQNPEAAEAAAFDHYADHDCAEDSGPSRSAPRHRDGSTCHARLNGGRCWETGDY